MHFRNRVVHSLPRYIQISGYNFKDILVKGAILSREAFDATVRRLGQLDMSMFNNIGKKLWWPIFESDLSVSKPLKYQKKFQTQMAYHILAFYNDFFWCNMQMIALTGEYQCRVFL